MGEQSEGRQKTQLLSFSYAITLNILGSCALLFYRVHIYFYADQPNTTYSETIFCNSVDSMYLEMLLY